MKRKKKNGSTAYIIGFMTVVLTLAAAFLVVTLASGEDMPSNGDLSSENSEVISSEDEHSAEKDDFNPYSEEEESEPEKPSEPVHEIKPKAEGMNEDDIAELTEIITRYGGNISIYYKDVDSEDTFLYNEEYKYFIASVIKAPYVMYILDLASQGKADLDKEYTIEYKDIQEGTGKIRELKEEEFPLTMTTKDLLSYAIRYSDNTAVETLRKEDFTHIGYTEYAKELGLTHIEDVKYIVNGDITATDAGIYINAIYDFIKTNEYGGFLKEEMLNTRNPMIYAKYPVIRKYGWADLSFHDFAIIDAPHPYMLVILTDKDEGGEEDYKFFAEFSRAIGRIHDDKYHNIDNEE